MDVERQVRKYSSTDRLGREDAVRHTDGCLNADRQMFDRYNNTLLGYDFLTFLKLFDVELIVVQLHVIHDK